jgi:hypothetical protein
MKIPREAWFLAALIVVMLVVIVLLRGGLAEPGEQGSFVRTTYSARPQGLRGIYMTLHQLGYDVRRMRASFNRLTLPEQGRIVIVDPAMPVTEREWLALYAWIAAGHAAILAGEDLLPYPTRVFPMPEDLFAQVPLRLASATQPTFLARDVKDLAVRAELRIQGPGAAPNSEEPKGRRHAGPRAWFGGGEYPPKMDEALRRAVPLFRDAEGTVVAYARVGQGTVILFASPWSLSNEGIAKADNVMFVLNALGRPGAGPVYFDEYHQGYTENIMWALVPLAGKLALAQLLVALLVVMYARSRRFGAIIPLDRGRRERSEFLGTMTALLRKGMATRLAVRTAYDAAMQRLRVEFGLAADATAPEVARAAERISAQAAQKLGAALRQCRGVLDGPETLTEARALALVRQLDEAVKSVRQV